MKALKCIADCFAKLTSNKPVNSEVEEKKIWANIVALLELIQNSPKDVSIRIDLAKYLVAAKYYDNALYHFLVAYQMAENKVQCAKYICGILLSQGKVAEANKWALAGDFRIKIKSGICFC